jgi:ElaB/YqjD/DUF883 family membrane-anchored ribosome-binding protein
LYPYATIVYGDVTAAQWRATARAAANGMKPARTAVKKPKERRMTTTDGQKGSRDASMTEHFAAKAHETVDTIAERAQRAEREVRSAAERTAEQARQLREQYAETAEQSLRRATSYLESKPLAVVGIAFLAGVLLSALIRR